MTTHGFDPRSFRKKQAGVLGMGKSGQSVARLLAKKGFKVIGSDARARGDLKKALKGLPAKVKWEGGGHSDRLLACSFVVKSPGLKPDLPILKKLTEKKIPVYSELEIALAFSKAKGVVAITGTNGKSTTTALIAHIAKSAGRDVALGGNIGTPILELDPPSPERIHVVECSSFQIDLAPSLDPSVGLMLNVTPDHIDRHGSLENYAAIKERLVAHSQVALIGVDDEICRAVAQRLRAREGGETVAVSQAPSPLADVYVEDHRIYERGRAEPLLDLRSAPALRGEHNGQNAAFACAAARALGLSLDDIRRGVASFPGLAHRMEQVGRNGRVLFVNDSKATNADAAEKALKSFHDIYWILGGKPKEGGVEPLAPLFGRVAKAYLIGAASEAFAATLGGKVPHEFCGTLDKAVQAAADDAANSSAPEPVVLLSPACASYDQFTNFEVRGDTFRLLVKQRLEAK